jgi:hypothetical protein
VIRELDAASNCGIEKALYLDDATGEIWIAASIDGLGCKCPVPPEKAADAFAHPFCYLPPLPQ